MGTTSFVDMLLYLKKRVKLIVLIVLIGVVFAYVLANSTQQYTATVGIQYTYDGADEDLNPLGGQLDVYEVMKPSLIDTALTNMGSTLSMEDVRNKMSISPVIMSDAQEAQQAKIALGEVVTLVTTVYNVSYTCDGSLGGAFAQRFLYYLLEAYDDYFSRHYLQMQRIPDFMNVVDVASMDYMEKCDYIDAQLTALDGTFDKLLEDDAAFVSTQTGLDFAALKSFYYNLRTNQYDRLYATVRFGLLTQNKDLLIQGYRKRIEDIALDSKNLQSESEQSHEMVQLFYEQYKKNNLYYQARTTQLEDNQKNDNKNLVYDFDLSKMINTYDNILLRYVESGVKASDLKHDSEHYQQLIDEFSRDTVSREAKRSLYTNADKLLEEVAELSTKYANLANATLDDYYGASITDHLKYMMAVEVKPTVSTTMYLVMGFFIALLAGCAFAIILEIVLGQLTYRKFELLQGVEDEGITPKIIDSMTPTEHAFYEQAVSGFPEFYLMFQPIVRKGGMWEISETLVRWQSKRFGQVLPEEFLPIAEKYRLMDRLGEWILRQGCQQSIRWAKGGEISPCISVNYSTQQIESQSFIDTICRVVSEEKVDPRNILLEISGGGELHNVEQVASKFTALKALGLRLAIDRFGESMSSLRTLYDLPADMVKLDKRFLVSPRDADDRNASLLVKVISVCKELNLQICVCGIEEPWQVTQMEDIGAEYLQGFYFSSPLPIDAYEKRYVVDSLHSAPRAPVDAEEAGTDGVHGEPEDWTREE